MDKQLKRDMKKSRKRIYIFLAIIFPVYLALATILYFYAPSLINQQWIVILLMIAVGLIGYYLMNLIWKKIDDKKAKAPKKHDPFAD